MTDELGFLVVKKLNSFVNSLTGGDCLLSSANTASHPTVCPRVPP